MGTYHSIIATLPRLMSKETAEDYCAGPSNFTELVKDFGLVASKQKRGAAFFDREDIDCAINRMKLAYRSRAEA